MKSLRLLVLPAVFLLASTGLADARLVRVWSSQELLDKSDLAVEATPTAVSDTKEHSDLSGQPVVGIETKFTVSRVLKGDPATKTVVLHHYRAEGQFAVPNGPTFVSFDPKKKGIFRLFLMREADGRYAPVAGQTDPGSSVVEGSAK